MKRRTLIGTAGLAGAALGTGLLSGCGDETPATAENGEEITTIRFCWWGSAPRHEATYELLADFESRYPIKVEGQTADFTDHWTRLATQVAARDAPDVINMEERYVAEYGKRGALADLRQVPGLDLTEFGEDALATGTVDGTLYALPTGQNAYQVMANKTLFEELGVELPDDTSWTWDDYRALAEALSEKGNGEILGTDYGTGQDADLQVWLRQHGEHLFAPDGTIGCSADTVAAWLEHLLALSTGTAGISPAEYQEALTAKTEQLPFAVRRTAMSWWWTNHYATVHELTGDECVMLRVPSQTGNVADNGMYFKSAMFWSVNAATEHMDAAGTLINHLANDVTAGEFILVDRGVQVNQQVLEAITPKLGEHDKAVIAYMAELREEIKPPPPPPPPGAGAAQQIIKRYVGDVLFENQAPADAAQAMLDEVDQATE